MRCVMGVDSAYALSNGNGAQSIPAGIDEVAGLVRDVVSGYGRTIVAYSGGVDSSLVAELVHQVHGVDGCLVAIGVSPSLAEYELDSALSLAESRGWQLELVETAEFEDPRYTANAGDRCYYCKTELYTRLTGIARVRGYATIANGANVDDRGDYRPGMAAGAEFAVRSPLLECGIGKREVRQLAAHYGLPNWDKPAQPCLSSRVPYGTVVSAESLGMVARAELVLRGLGFSECRVRHYGSTARVEVPLGRMDELRAKWDDVCAGIRGAGYAEVEIEDRGLKSGRLNEALAGAVPAAGRT